MTITMYLYKNQLGKKPQTIHCLNCKRPLFKANCDEIVISNVGSDKLPPSAHYIEHKCHSCSTIYRVLFQ